MMNLSNREKKLLLILGSLLTAGFLYYFVISPVIEMMKSSDDIYMQNRMKINKIDEIYEEYKNITSEKGRLNATASANSGVGSIVEGIASSLGISGNKVYLKENPGVVQNGIQKITTEMKYEGITVKSLLELINRIESSNIPLKIQNVVITSGIKERNRYDAVITIVSLSKRQ